ncbi:T3SS effector HopA1 family protein [Streptomyces sp. NPDC001594]|uniref:T3SS effector HopA1 family protein n=1 Tax=Streptomyces sp. NPDC001594 TaxID=3364590 RepID=UPI0036B68487
MCYRAKILSSPGRCPRTDAMVVHLGADAWQLAAALPKALAGLPGTGTTTSILARRLSPGLAMAWEPDDIRPGYAHLSFGEHRAAALADGLIRHASACEPLSCDEAVGGAFTEAGIDPLSPDRNTGSPTLDP